jgi:hypothetical protein
MSVAPYPSFHMSGRYILSPNVVRSSLFSVEQGMPFGQRAEHKAEGQAYESGDQPPTGATDTRYSHTALSGDGSQPDNCDGVGNG